MKILAIETSCDETAIAIAEFSGSRLRSKIKILSNIVSSQVKLHAKFGGVVPNLAKREHQKNLVPILVRAFIENGWKNAKCKVQNAKLKFKIQNELNKILEREQVLLEQIIKKILPIKTPDIDAIAVTNGPGLAPALWVGVNFARALAYIWNKPLIPVNHMEGHLFSALLKHGGKNNFQYSIANIRFPALALLVSGGHTELVLMNNYGNYKIIGETLDDAAGEAFDKTARILGLGYPGGPLISKEAEKILNAKIQNSKFKIQNDPEQIALQFNGASNLKLKIKLPRPMLNSNDYNFSFSGLKTAVLYLVQDLKKIYPMPKIRPAVTYEFQNAVVDVLVSKTIRAAKEYNAKTILLGGGVAANKLLRKRLGEEIIKQIPDTEYLMPDTYMTGDNALMVALAAFFSEKKKARNEIQAEPNLRLS